MKRFNWKQYISNYPDLQLACINDLKKAWSHYKLYGVSENRTELQEKLKITNFREIPFEFISTGAQTIYED